MSYPALFWAARRHCQIVNFCIIHLCALNCFFHRHSTTRHLFYLQLRREILCGYISCQEEVAISLASLALQAEFGDYVEQFHGRCYFEAEHYLPGKVKICLRNMKIHSFVKFMI